MVIGSPFEEPAPSQLRKAVTGSRGTYGSFIETPSLQKPSRDYAEATKLTPTKRIRSTSAHAYTVLSSSKDLFVSVDETPGSAHARPGL